MPTIQEVLKQTGLTDEQIAALDQKVVTGLQQWGDQTLQTAAQKEEAAALNQRKLNDYIEKELNPALNNWGNKESEYAAKIAAYQAAFEQAKAAGFIPPEINIGTPGSPTLDANGQPRNAQGQFVAGQNPFPGSPAFNPEQFREGVGQYVGTMQDLQWKYQTLFGSPMPDPPTQIVREAREQRLDPIAYAAKKYGFQEKEKEIAAKREAERVEAIRKETIAERDKYWAERGANPALRPAEQSGFSQVQKAVQAGTRPDPTMQSEADRRRTTAEMIQRDIAEKAQVQ